MSSIEPAHEPRDFDPSKRGVAVLLWPLAADLATMVSKSGRALSPTQKHMVDALRLLPELAELRRIDILEIAFPPAIETDDAPTNSL